MIEFTAYDHEQDERITDLESRVRQLEGDFQAVGIVQGKTTMLVAAHDETLKKWKPLEKLLPWLNWGRK